jgi:hypothetical protein
MKRIARLARSVSHACPLFIASSPSRFPLGKRCGTKERYRCYGLQCTRKDGPNVLHCIGPYLSQRYDCMRELVVKTS